MSRYVVSLGLVLLLVTLVPLSGCAQETKGVNVQTTPQAQSPTQREAAQSPQYVYVYQACQFAHESGPGQTSTTVIRKAPTSQPSDQPAASLDSANTGRLANKATTASDGQVVAGNTLTLTVTGTAGGAQTQGDTTGGAQSPNLTSTQSPEFRPQAQVNPALAFGMPGSAPNASSTSTGFEGSGAATSTNQPTQTASAAFQELYNKACGGDPAAMQEFLKQAGNIFKLPFPAASQPAPTPTP